MTDTLLTAWAELLLDSLADAGVREVVISPGSRSTPFVHAAIRHPLLTTTDLIDERSAGFYALGQGRATGRPSVLLCTSGTAGANYLPAVIEAGMSHTPLVVLTADRPFELAGCAAPQTIDQVKLFGDHPRAFFELGMPDPSPGALRALRRIAVQAVHASRWPTPGAVHCNARARKPLEPIEDSGAEAVALGARVAAIRARPTPQALTAPSQPAREAIEHIALAIAGNPHGLLIAGPMPLHRLQPGADRSPFFGLAAAAGYPILVEATSQLRFVPGAAASGVTVIDALDAVVDSETFRSTAPAPNLLIQIGAPPTSGAWQRYLAAFPEARRILLAEHGWNDPENRAEILCLADPAATAEALVEKLVGRVDQTEARRQWREFFRHANDIAWRGVAAQLRTGEDRLTEGAVPRLVVEALPPGSLLGVGNSLPVRQVDRYAATVGKELAVWCQRGANGIDGVVSGFAGSATQHLSQSAEGARQGSPAAALIVGDVSFLHDLGGLAAARLHRRRSNRPLVIVVVHNDGGRIFEQLPLASAPGVAKAGLDSWLTPHGLRLEPAIRMYGLGYARVDSVGGLQMALSQAFGGPGCSVIEAVVPIHGAAEQNRALRERLEGDFQALAEVVHSAEGSTAPDRRWEASKEALVLLHGFSGSPQAWQRVQDALPPSVQALPLPLPGHGPQAPVGGNTFESAVDALADRIRALGRGPFQLAGYSLGGRVALSLLVRYPELFSRATLIGTHPGLAADAERRDRQETDERWARLLEDKGLPAFIERWEALPLFGSQQALPQAVREWQRRQRLRNDAVALAWSLRTLGLGQMPCYLPHLEAIQQPVHLVVGELDEKFRRLAEAMAGRLPRNRLTIIPAAGHNVVLEAPRSVAALLEEGVQRR
jgi:2-succinyl-5-enolpyruvyl-6-hydroxy-3-cyclohexene-1-carboxylate synthase